ncbi:MAG: hypothetical protein K2H45_11300, partial [Acetatifactor sp.]|nr:hypothetical protein [Acetatifactor sp.]
MLRAENLQNEKIMNALEELGLGGGELEAAGKYLRGEAGEEILAGMTFRNMMQMPPEKPKAFDALFSSCFKKKRNEEATRLFNLLYAVGGSTCCACFRYMYDFNNALRNGLLKIEPAKALAVYIQDIADGRHNIIDYSFRVARNYAQSDSQIVLQAYNEYKGQYSNGRILLLTLYFYLRCGQEDLAVGAEILNDKDRELLKAYEDMLVGPLGMVISPDASKEPQICEIQKQIRQGGLTSDMLLGVRDRAVNENIFKLLGGCAYINYMLSEKLHSVVRFCSAVSPEQMLCVMEEMDLRNELKYCSGELEEL